MSEPVLVIHGVAMRSEDRVRQLVAGMNELVDPQRTFIPVYWGDLGPEARDIDKLMGRYTDRSKHAGSMIVDAMAGSVASGLGRTLAWVTKRRGDLDGATEIRDAYHKARQLLQKRARGYLNDKFQDMRLWMTSALMPFVADVIVYQSPAQRAKIQQRVRQVIDEQLSPEHGTASRPVTIIAHSLGGVIAFDMAVSQQAPLHIDNLVTLGSQPALFHLMDPRPGVLPAYEGEPIALPPSLRQWTNIWDEFDILAFGAGEVFRLPDGSSPHEEPVRCYYTALEGAAFMMSHLGYWQKKPAIKAVKRALKIARHRSP